MEKGIEEYEKADFKWEFRGYDNEYVRRDMQVPEPKYLWMSFNLDDYDTPCFKMTIGNEDSILRAHKVTEAQMDYIIALSKRKLITLEIEDLTMRQILSFDPKDYERLLNFISQLQIHALRLVIRSGVVGMTSFHDNLKLLKELEQNWFVFIISIIPRINKTSLTILAIKFMSPKAVKHVTEEFVDELLTLINTSRIDCLHHKIMIKEYVDSPEDAKDPEYVKILKDAINVPPEERPMPIKSKTKSAAKGR